MSAGELMHFVHRRPNGNVNVFAGEMEGLTRHWHPMLPADQTADAAERC